MSRKKSFKIRKYENDPIYNSEIANKLINKLLIKGKKSLAQKIFYKTMINLKELNKNDPLETLKKAITNISPTIELKSRRIGGATYQIPTEIKENRRKSLALKFLIKSTRARSGKNIIEKLQNEILDAYNNIGNSIKKKEEIHKMAEANRVLSNIKP